MTVIENDGVLSADQVAAVEAADCLNDVAAYLRGALGAPALVYAGGRHLAVHIGPNSYRSALIIFREERRRHLRNRSDDASHRAGAGTASGRSVVPALLLAAGILFTLMILAPHQRPCSAFAAAPCPAARTAK